MKDSLCKIMRVLQNPFRGFCSPQSDTNGYARTREAIKVFGSVQMIQNADLVILNGKVVKNRFSQHGVDASFLPDGCYLLTRLIGGTDEVTQRVIPA